MEKDILIMSSLTDVPVVNKINHSKRVSRFSVSFDCFWDVNISTHIDVSRASQWLVENFAPFLLGTFRSEQKFKDSRQEAATDVNYLNNCYWKAEVRWELKSVFICFNSLFLSSWCCCSGANYVIVFSLKTFWTKRLLSLHYFTCFVDFWNLTNLHKDATLNLFL